MRNWPTWLWRLRSPTICHPQAEGPRKMVSKLSQPKGSRIGNTYVQGQEKMDVSPQAEKANSSFLHLLVLFGPLADWMMSLHWWGWIFFIWVTNSNANLFLVDTPRNNASPAIWASLSPVKLTGKINHHNVPPFSLYSRVSAIPQGMWDMPPWVFSSSGKTSSAPSTLWQFYCPPPVWKNLSKNVGWPWAVFLTILGPGFFLCKMGIRIVQDSWAVMGSCD